MPVHLIFSLEKSFSLIKEETIEKRIKRHEKISGPIRSGLAAMRMKIMADEKYYSNTVRAMMLDNLNMNDFLNECLSNGVKMATGIIPEYAGKYIRIGHMGWINENDAISTISVIERSLNKFGKKIKYGKGITAAQEYLANFK